MIILSVNVCMILITKVGQPGAHLKAKCFNALKLNQIILTQPIIYAPREFRCLSDLVRHHNFFSKFLAVDHKSTKSSLCVSDVLVKRISKLVLFDIATSRGNPNGKGIFRPS